MCFQNRPSFIRRSDTTRAKWYKCFGPPCPVERGLYVVGRTDRWTVKWQAVMSDQWWLSWRRTCLLYLIDPSPVQLLARLKSLTHDMFRSIETAFCCLPHSSKTAPVHSMQCDVALRVTWLSLRTRSRECFRFLSRHSKAREMRLASSAASSQWHFHEHSSTSKLLILNAFNSPQRSTEPTKTVGMQLIASDVPQFTYNYLCENRIKHIWRVYALDGMPLSILSFKKIPSIYEIYLQL